MLKKYDLEVKNRMAKKFPEELTNGLFRKRTYKHIFKKLEYNFIDGTFPEFKSLKGNLTEDRIKYHYAEHMNSSQTMCIAYFKKFFEEEKHNSLLAEILMMHNIDLSCNNEITDAVFEYIPYPKEGTNFDFYLKTGTGRQITWEVKFTESEFGCTTKSYSNSSKYINKYKDIYIPMLRECAYYDYPEVSCDDYHCLKNGVLSEDCPVSNECSINEFYKYYQIRRNILYARKKGDYVIFLTPRENYFLDEGRRYIEQYARKWGTECICNIYWEDLLETTLKVVSCDSELYDYYIKFKEKYFGE